MFPEIPPQEHEQLEMKGAQNVHIARAADRNALNINPAAPYMLALNSFTRFQQ